MYIDPKDQPIDTSDTVLSEAWNDRKALRLQKLQTEKEIEALDAFITAYIERAKPEYKGSAMQQSATTVMTTGAAAVGPVSYFTFTG